MPIEHRTIQEGAEFIEVDCYDCRRGSFSLIILHLLHLGYAHSKHREITGRELEEADKIARQHNPNHRIVITRGIA